MWRYRKFSALKFFGGEPKIYKLMGKKEKRKRVKCSASDSILPLEIITEIVARLPVESVIACKCVCKAWNFVLSNNYFARKHLARSQTNASSSHILFEAAESGNRNSWYVSMKRYLLNVNNRKLRKIRVYPHLKTAAAPKLILSKNMPVVSSLDGLICFSSRNSYSADHPIIYNRNSYSAEYPPIVIYNPLIRGDYVRLPHSESGTGDQTATLGFDYSINKYKVVKTLVYEGKDHSISIMGCEVFTVGKDSSWREVKFEYSRFKFYNRGTFHQGSIYWMIRGMDQGCILEFDLTKEVFSVVSIPSSIRQPNYHSWGRVQLHSLGEHLSLTERECRVVRIWKLVKQNTGTKFDGYRIMKIELPYKNAVTLGFNFLNKNEDLLLLRTRGGFEQAGSENAARIKVKGNHYTLYRPAAPYNRLRNLSKLRRKFARAITVHALCFTPSLVSIKEAMRT